MRHIELWGRPPGLLSSQAPIKILKNLCNLSLHHVGDRNFKITITSLDIDSVYSLYLDVNFDEASFEKYFKWVDPDEFAKNL